jgi:hypothetical protein
MSKDEENAIEMFDPDGERNSMKDTFSSKVHVIDEDQEDPDIDMDLTVADINRAFVSIFILCIKIAQWGNTLC